jgi:hypothetical protein
LEQDKRATFVLAEYVDMNRHSRVLKLKCWRDCDRKLSFTNN